MGKRSKIVWGLVLVVLGTVFALNTLKITKINVFFDGWWTLFIIVPNAIGLFLDKNKVDKGLGLALGVFLLLCCREVLSWNLVWPGLLVALGLRLMFGAVLSREQDASAPSLPEKGKCRTTFAAFSGCDFACNAEEFEGARLTAIFGGVDCDLRNAVITKDCTIEAYAVFGGVDILVPEGVNVKVDSLGVFGGVSNTTVSQENVPTIYIKATCAFGGIDIKSGEAEVSQADEAEVEEAEAEETEV